MSKQGRVYGYKYVVGPDGKKHRDYTNAQRTLTTDQRKALDKGYVSSKRDGIYVPTPNGYVKVARSAIPREFRGTGGYYDSGFVKTMNRYVPKGSFANAGRVIGGPLGGLAGDAFAKLAGFGAYSVKSNSIVSEGQSPAVMHSANNRFKVRHREYIQDIVSSSVANAFQLNSYNLNPGLQQVFPWLAPIASQFEEYKILGMVFEFKTLYADAIASSAANSSIGGVIMATDYNANNANFLNKQQMDNTQYTTSDKPSCSFYHPIECNPRDTPMPMLYVRNGALAANIDVKTYDLGVFQIASFGIASTSVTLGELWVSYEVELSKPISTAALGQDILSDHSKLAGTINATHPMGSGSVPVSGSTLGGTLSSVGYQWPAWVQEGTYLVYWVVSGSATGSLVLPTATGTNCTLLAIELGDSVGQVAVPQGAGLTSQNCSIMFVAQITAASASFVLSTAGVTLPASITQGDLFVTEIASQIIT